MEKSELFHASLKAERWRSLSWRLTIFNLATLPDSHIPRDYDINYIDDFPHYYLNGEWHKVTDGVKGEGLYNPREPFTMVGLWGNDETIQTTYGRALANFTVWYYAFGTRFEFVNADVMPDDWLESKLTVAVDDDADVSGMVEYITATEIGNFIQGVLELKCLAKYITATGTEITLATHPEMDALRERLLEENKDNLDKPSVVADIIEQLDAKDMEWLAQDSSIDYFRDVKDPSKAISKRRKVYVIEGISSAFREDGSFILQSEPLMNGWKKSELVAKFNETREGSHQRGAETAKGGEKVTFLQSTFQNHRVVSGDCGAEPLPTVITKLNGWKFLGLNAVIDNKLVPITKNLIKEYNGKALYIRRAFLCKQQHIDVCSACANKSYAASPHAIANEEASIGSFTMYGAMRAMHAVDLKVAEFIPFEHIA